jgi:hypothetical protein
LIFVAVVVAWLVYLVPHHLASRAPAPAALADLLPPPTELTTPLPGKVSGPGSLTLHKGLPEVAAEPSEETTTANLLDDLFDLPVATDLTRRAQRHSLNLMARRSACARRRSLLAGTLVALVALGLFLAGLTGWITPTVAGGALILGLGLAHWNSVRVERRLDRLRRAIDRPAEEATVALTVDPTLSQEAVGEDAGLAVTGTAARLSLWDPLPVPVATYLSQPLAPRTIRTIDLAAPVPVPPVPVVTAEGLEETAAVRAEEASEEAV